MNLHNLPLANTAARIFGIDRDFLEEMREAGFEDLAIGELVALRVHGVDGRFVREFRQGVSGLDLSGELTPEALVAVKVLSLTPQTIGAYAEEMRALGLRDLTLWQIIELMGNHIDRDFILRMRALGLHDLTPDQLVKLKSADIDAGLIGKIRS